MNKDNPGSYILPLITATNQISERMNLYKWLIENKETCGYNDTQFNLICNLFFKILLPV